MELSTDGLRGSLVIGPVDQEDWYPCVVSVRADGFSGEFDCWFRGGELRQFAGDLEDAISKIGHKSTITFRALEGGVAFVIELDPKGHVEGRYEFNRDWRGPTLSGSFTADQTHLVAWAKELRRALAK
jgi:hypothetical protein